MRTVVQKPNVLLIIADQLRYDCLGFSGMAPVRTPCLDRLASEGMWFGRAFNHIPVCGPARQSLVCGQRPETFGGLWNYSLGLKVGSLQPEAYSWARSLKEAGYRNGYIGKWDVNPSADPTLFGYDEYVDSDKQYNAFIRENYPDLQYMNGAFGETDPLPLQDTRTHQTARLAAEMLQTLHEAGSPWHLRVNFHEPHLPCRPAGEFAAMYRPEEVPEWGSFRETFAGKPYIQRQQLLNWGIENYTWKEWAPIVARYFGIISQLDDAVGRLLQRLEELGMAEDTLVVFTSDHGDLCGGHRMFDKHYILYEDVVKVPMIVRWPTAIPEGTRCDRFVYNLLDLPPTLLELCGAAAPENHRFHGESLVPLLFGDSPRSWREEVVATYNGQQFGLYTQRMIRTDRWKYIWNHTDVDELYDLEADPHELHNVAGHPLSREVLQDLRRRLYEILLRDGDGLVRNSWMKAQLLEGRKL